MELDGSTADNVRVTLEWFQKQILSDAELQDHALGHFASDHYQTPVYII